MATLRHSSSGANVNEVYLPNGCSVLFSYASPVAIHVPGVGYFRNADTQRSTTTSRHINAWGAKDAPYISDAEVKAKLGLSELP